MAKTPVQAALRGAVKARSHSCCEYCLSQEEFSPDTFSVDHILPIAKGGAGTSDNLANACQQCNNHKYASTDAIDPLTGEVAPLYHPRQDRWSDHFAWNEDATQIIGITATGRATVIKLHLNRTGVVNLRRLLRTQGLHPLGDQEWQRGRQ